MQTPLHRRARWSWCCWPPWRTPPGTCWRGGADEKLAFLWCGTLVAAVLFLPLGVWLLLTEPIPPLGWAVVALSAGLEALYYWTLAQAYRYGDLSLVYPIARGTAPILVPILAALFLGERLSGLATGGHRAGGDRDGGDPHPPARLAEPGRASPRSWGSWGPATRC